MRTRSNRPPRRACRRSRTAPRRPRWPVNDGSGAPIPTLPNPATTTTLFTHKVLLQPGRSKASNPDAPARAGTFVVSHADYPSVTREARSVGGRPPTLWSWRPRRSAEVSACRHWVSMRAGDAGSGGRSPPALDGCAQRHLEVALPPMRCLYVLTQERRHLSSGSTLRASVRRMRTRSRQPSRRLRCHRRKRSCPPRAAESRPRHRPRTTGRVSGWRWRHGSTRS